MTPADEPATRLLEHLREAGEEAVAFAELHAAGIAVPRRSRIKARTEADVIERACDQGRLIGVRLLQPERRTDPPHTGDADGPGTDSQPR